MIFPLVGNEKTVSTVQNFIKEKRIPHAILILGDEGVGKHTLAFFLANAIVCGKADAPCGMCDNCRLATSSNHPDITVIAPEDDKKSITEGQIRNMRQEAFIKPHKSEKRVFLIDGADTMNPQSQNALLKVLEEPPESVMFLLVAENKAAFLDTIISRCVVLNVNDASDCKADTKAFLAAEEFLKYLMDNDQYNMLITTHAFSKKRVDSDRFIKSLKTVVAERIKSDPNSHFAKPLLAFYNEIFEYEHQLQTNINLNLFYCNVVCSAIQIIWRNK